MKYLKTFEYLNRLEETAEKEQIEKMVWNVMVDLDVTYLDDGDKDYDRIINQDSIIKVADKITKFMINVLSLDNKEYDEHYDNIKDYLNELEMEEDEGVEELDKDSVKYVTREIYNYIDEYSYYELDEKYEIYKSIKKYNL